MSDAVDRFLAERIGAAFPSGRVLDLPAGRGDLSRLLDSRGYQITPSDLFPEALCWEGHEAVKADMNERLPFEDDGFDVVVCQEGVEHIENPAAFFRECRRTLRSGGRLYLTTPNFMDLSSRLAWPLTGMKSFHAGFANEETTLWGREGAQLYHGHAFSLPYFQIRYLLRVSGFRDVRLEGLKPSPLSSTAAWLLRPVSALLIRRAFRRLDRKSARRDRKRAPDEPLRSELLREALSSELLCHRKICVQATAD